MSAENPSIAVLLVTFNSADDVGPALAALEAQRSEGDEIIVLDNASADGTVATVRAVAPHARVIESAENLGFAGGVNRAAESATTDLLLLLNPDAVPEAGCLEALRRTATAEPTWGCWQALVALADGQHVNTAGGRVHLLGFGWSGDWEEPVDPYLRRHPVGFASGAALCVRREIWDRLGGFDPHYFMYCEDLDFSVRVRSAGWGVGVEPAAVVRHDYDFDKGAAKWFYLERNRWATLIATYPARLLVVLAPALFTFELVLLVVAAAGGWLPSKLRAMRAVVADLRHNLARRRVVQSQRVISDRTFADALTVELDGAFFGSLAKAQSLRLVQRLYARLVLAALGRT